MEAEKENELNRDVKGEKEDPCACITKMSEWMAKGDSQEECRSCLLGPVTQWYRDELQERGFTELAHDLEAMAVTGQPVEVAQKLDTIKESVPEDVRLRLKDFDCAAQIHTEEETNEQ